MDQGCGTGCPRRVPLAVAANKIIIGGLSHSSSTAAWQSGWLFGDGAVAAAVTVTVAAAAAAAAVGLYSIPWRPSATRVRESNGERCLRKSARGT